MITLRRRPEDRLLELGGGSRPLLHPTCLGGKDVCVDVRECQDEQGRPTVDFTADFEKPLPIQSEEFDGVVSQYCLEHVSWRTVPQFLSEVCRVLKPGGKVVVITSNTLIQMEWINKNPQGWDGKGIFESASCVLFGDMDYPENSHRSFFSPEILHQLFRDAGFENVETTAYGARGTDIVVQAVKGSQGNPVAIIAAGEHKGKVVESVTLTAKKHNVQIRAADEYIPPEKANPLSGMTREQMYDKHYFNGGGKVGGYAREGYWDFPVHHITAQHILARKPESVLEIGASRGYVLKRIQDAGVKAEGLEISKHCVMTRVCEGITQFDICGNTWPQHQKGTQRWDLCFSIATLEHIPEEFLPDMIKQMEIVCKRGLHGIDFWEHDDGFDKTHTTLRPKAWWEATFAKYAPGWPVEIVDKEELKKGDFPPQILHGDGRVKLNIGSHCVMNHWGWQNLDILDLNGFAQANGYRFQQHDVRQGLPYATGTVSAIFSSHFLEHLTYSEGLTFLRECRRVLMPETGALRILVPDAGLLMGLYNDVEPVRFYDRDVPISWKDRLNEFDEINDECAASPTAAGKLWALLHNGHSSCYDQETLSQLLSEAGFQPRRHTFREQSTHPMLNQMLKECMEYFPCLTLAMDGIPLVG